MSTTDAVILAGGRTDPAWQAVTGVEYRALVPLDGEPMYRRVLQALQDVSAIGERVVVGDVPPGEDYRQVEAGENLIEAVIRGLQASQSEAILFCTVDLPFLTRESVEYFLTECERSGTALCYAIVPAALCREQFPRMKRTTVRLREGEFTGGNLFWAKREVVQAQLPRLKSLYAARKQPIRMALQVGIGILLRAVLAQYLSPKWLSIADIEKRAQRLLGVPGKAIICPYAEIGTDIDSLEQWQQLSGVG